MRHFLIVGTGSELQPRLRAMAPDGQTMVLCRASTLELVHGIGDNQAVVVLGDQAPTARWVRAALAVHQEWRVHHVVSFSEIDQDKAAHVAAALDLPGHAVDTVAAVHDKALMRVRLAEAGLSDVPHLLVTDLAHLEEWYDRIGPPLILKPSRGRASVGVSVITRRAGLAEAYQRTTGARAPRLDPSPPLAERYLAGPEYSVEAITHDRTHYVFAITEKFTDPATKVELGHVVPARISPADERAIVRYVRAALTALGVTAGVTHTEVILAPGGPVLVETHLRGAGDEIPHLVEDATGDDIMELFLRQVIGEDIGRQPALRSRREGPHYRASAAIRYLTSPACGPLAGIDGWAEAAVVPGVRDHRQLHPDGTVLSGLQSSRSRLGYVRVCADDPSAAVRLAESTVDRLTVRTE